MYSSLRYLEAAMPTRPVDQPPQATINSSTIYLTFAFPILIGITVFSFFKYRSTRKQNQIKILEQIWRKDTDTPRQRWM